MTYRNTIRWKRFGRRTLRPFLLAGAATGLLLCAALRAQAQHHGGPGGMRGGMGGGAFNGGDLDRPHEDLDRRPTFSSPMRSGPMLAPPGLWWDDNTTVQRLSLRPEQKQHMDDIFTANKSVLLTGFENLQREESRLNDMSARDRQDETKVFAAIDRVSQARTDLAKELAHFQLQLRQQLTPAQLQELDKEVASLR